MSAASSTSLAPSTITSASSSSSANNDATIALTTTFTPPSPCASHHLTMVTSGFVWLNEPMPISGMTFSSCYPSSWIANYTSTSSSSIVPVASPLVCPSGWEAATSVSQGSLSGYFACCPSSWGLALPSTTAVTTRPFYGGTCYSDFTQGDTTTVTTYYETDSSATVAYTPAASAQAFAHPIDGFVRAAVIATATSTSAATSGGSSASSSTAASAQSSGASSGTGSSSSGLSGGAIAGIVIGVVAGVALLALAAWALLRRRRKASPSAAAVAGASEKDATSPGGVESDAALNNELHGTNVVELGGEARQVHEVGGGSKGLEGSWHGGPRAEMDGRGVHDVAELDGESPGGGNR